jgi:hypothetical protein
LLDYFRDRGLTLELCAQAGLQWLKPLSF